MTYLHFSFLFDTVFHYKRSLIIVICSMLIACGGEGGSVSPSAPAPTVNISLPSATVITGQTVSLSWSSTNASSCTASGAWSGAQAISGSLSVSQLNPGTYNYGITCAGGAGSATGNAILVVAAGGNNTVPVVVDSGPMAGNSVINAPYVSVTVCRPGTTICQTIDHVLLDTGSYGLRLLTPLNAALALPSVHTPSGADAGECAQFVSGYTWGAVKQADVKIGNELALAQSVHIINTSPGGFAGTPTTCSSIGNNIGTISALGANGVLGVGLFKEDCGNSCASSAVAGTYYSCAGTGCIPTTMPLAQQVSNPVASFAINNNGILLTLPDVPEGGATSISGTLIFGINTQSNNKLNGTAIYTANSSGNFSTVYKGRTLTSSFLDSGSNGLYFDDSDLPACTLSKGFYCPASPLLLSATNVGVNGTAGAISFKIESVDKLPGTIAAASIGGKNGSVQLSSSSNTFNWGLPFFFGRRVYVGFERTVNGVVERPYWAY